MADMLDLFKVGALLFSRDPLRTWQRVDEMKAQKQNQGALEGLFGPMQTKDGGTVINWNTPRPVDGASPQMQQLLQNPAIGQLMQAPQFKQQIAEAVLGDIMPKGAPQLKEVAPGASLVPVDRRTGLPISSKAYTAPKAPDMSDLAKLKADFDAGRIDKPTYDSAVMKMNYIAPQAPRKTARMLSKAEAEKMGLPATGSYKIDSDGDVVAVVQPKQDAPTESQAKFAYNASRAADAMAAVQDALKRSPGAATNWWLSATEGIPGLQALGRATSNDDAQIVRNNMSDATDAVITLGTGAAYTSEQLKAAKNSILPQVGESDAVKREKFRKLSSLYAQAKTNARSAGADLPDISEFSSLLGYGEENQGEPSNNPSDDGQSRPDDAPSATGPNGEKLYFYDGKWQK